MTEPPQAPESRHEGEPDWGCAEFREAIAWMRERWPELAADAEHPILEALIAARREFNPKPWLQPSSWFNKERKDLLWTVMQTPLSAREMAAIEMGYAARNEMRNMRTRQGRGLLLLATFTQAIFCIGAIIWTLDSYPPNFPRVSMLDFYALQTIWTWGIFGTVFQILAIEKHLNQRYMFMRRAFLELLISMSRGTRVHIPRRKIRVPPVWSMSGLIFGLTTIYILWSQLHFFSPLMFIAAVWAVFLPSIALVSLFVPNRANDPELITSDICEWMPLAEEAYLHQRSLFEEYAPGK